MKPQKQEIGKFYIFVIIFYNIIKKKKKYLKKKSSNIHKKEYIEKKRLDLKKSCKPMKPQTHEIGKFSIFVIIFYNIIESQTQTHEKNKNLKNLFNCNHTHNTHQC